MKPNRLDLLLHWLSREYPDVLNAFEGFEREIARRDESQRRVVKRTYTRVRYTFEDRRDFSPSNHLRGRGAKEVTSQEEVLMEPTVSRQEFFDLVTKAEQGSLEVSDTLLEQMRTLRKALAQTGHSPSRG